MGRLVWIISGIAILAGVAAAFFVLRPDEVPAPTAEQSPASGNASFGANGESSIITYSDTGFTPSSITIPAGTTITWSNQSSEALLIVSSDSNDSCSEQNPDVLNGCTSVGNGGTYSFTFTVPGTYTYTNQEHADATGTITVSGDAEAAGPINRNAILQ